MNFQPINLIAKNKKTAYS